MAFTREFIRKLAKESDVDLPKELIDGLISEHLTARDAFSEEQVKQALEQNKSNDQQTNVKDSDEYKALEKQFNDYKDDIAKKESKAATDGAKKALIKSLGVPEKWADRVFESIANAEIQLDKDGKIKDAEAFSKTITDKWSDVIPETTERGAYVATPPAGGKRDGDVDLGSLPMKDYIAAREKMK